MKTTFLTIAMLILTSLTYAQKTTEVTLKLNNVKEQKGAWMVAVFAESDEFLGKKPSYAKRQDVDSKNEIVFNLPKGNYSIALFQDLNSNMQLDRESNGMPKEPYSFSGENIFPLRGKPTFEQTKFKVKRKKKKLVLSVQN